MKVTIDSTEPLQDALRVIGALYNVTLALAEPANAPVTNPPTRTTRTTRTERLGAIADRGSAAQPPQQAAAPRSARRQSRRAANAAAAPKASEIRAWAKANGHQISDRGPMPAAVITEYRQVHPQG